ncbi:spherulation-specific family 4 protein [Actinomadura pelletieri DSM 43383]|uniref:Spherulation-specific family 4 protein n=1 Tax=Actinomadura pelletieri DSM 43383 TaxID=1120940 RepID=A0A495QTS4_9ACTN|nr:spherulation-specific family 4 protein [Actinomadura pelletieri]RKS76926.1 spherulation-specific family 4 protein [Actinomadura pelletieri DSM 43383]
MLRMTSEVKGRVTSVAVPAYFHPTALDWTTVADPRLGAVVFNVDSGVGSVRDRAFTAVAQRMADAGVRLVGYVDTAYGTRPAREIEDEVTRYRKWYGIQMVFLDEVSSVPGHVVRYERIAAGVRRRGAEHIVFNHGTYPDSAYAELADLLVTFEGPWSAYQHVRAPAWATQMPAERFCHLVYAAPQAVLARALARAGRRNAGVVYVTDRAGVNPWSGLPGYFSREMNLVYAHR